MASEDGNIAAGGSAVGQPLRWAIVGCGSVSQDFTRALKIADRSHKITVVGGSSAEHFKKVLLLSDRTKLFDDHCAAIDAVDDYDLVYIATYACEHAPLAARALARGKHALCERPLAPSANVTRQLVELARRNKCFLMEGYWSRFFPSWQQIRRSQKELGRVSLVQASLCYNKLDRHDAHFCSLAHTPSRMLLASPSLLSINSWASNGSYGDGDGNSSATGNGNRALKHSEGGNHLCADCTTNSPLNRNRKNENESDAEADEKRDELDGMKPVFLTSSMRQLSGFCAASSCSGIEYTVNFALWVYDGQMPTRISAVGRSDDRGNDLWGSVTLEFDENRIATLYYSTTQSSYSPAVVIGANGTLILPDRFWCCTQLIAEYGNPRATDSKQTLKFPIRKDNRGYQYPNGIAFYFEADHVYDCIANGQLESDVMPLEDSLKIAAIIDEIRDKIAAANAPI